MATTLCFEDGGSLVLDGDRLVNGPREEEITEHFIGGRGLVTHFLIAEVPGERKQVSLRCLVLEIHRPDQDHARTFFRVRPLLCDRAVVVSPESVSFRYYVNRNKGEHVDSFPSAAGDQSRPIAAT